MRKYKDDMNHLKNHLSNHYSSDIQMKEEAKKYFVSIYFPNKYFKQQIISEITRQRIRKKNFGRKQKEIGKRGA